MPRSFRQLVCGIAVAPASFKTMIAAAVATTLTSAQPLPLTWVAQDGASPPVIGGFEGGNPLVVCRGTFGGSVYGGKFVNPTFNHCTVPAGGGERDGVPWSTLRNDTALQLQWTAVDGALPPGALPAIASTIGTMDLWICRAAHAGSLHPGWMNGTAAAAFGIAATPCTISYGGSVLLRDGAVLYGYLPPSATPSPSPTPSPTPTQSPTPSMTPSPTPTPSATPSATPSPSSTPLSTTSSSVTPTTTVSSSPSPSLSPSTSATPEVAAGALVGGAASAPRTDVIVGGVVGGVGVILMVVGIAVLVRRLRAMESVARQLANKQRVFVGGPGGSGSGSGVELNALRTLAAGGAIDNPVASGKVASAATATAAVRPDGKRSGKVASGGVSGGALRVSRLWGGGGGRLTRAVGEVVVVGEEKASV